MLSSDIFYIKIPKSKINNLDNDNVFYSDGITEAMNRNREEFGTDKVMDIISLNRQNSCSLIQKEIINSVDLFRGSAEQNDDITLVITKIKSLKKNSITSS